jgi:hypothetical protein
MRFKSQYQYFADLVKKDITAKKPVLADVLTAVWKNPEVTAVCPDLVIRLTSLRGQVSRIVWEGLGNDPNEINILAVGTTDIPQHLKSYHGFLHRFYQKISDCQRKMASEEAINFPIGYDLMSQGSEDARSAVLTLFNDHFGFSSSQLSEAIRCSAITCGGMRGLKDLADSCVEHAKKSKLRHRFIQPDNSFGTWFNIVDSTVFSSVDNVSQRDQHIITIPTKPENKLHLHASDVVAFYQNNKGGRQHGTFDTWYITPVGNPSGTKIEGLHECCQEILKHNPDALIILDSVYVRTLSISDARKIMTPIISDNQLMKSVIFLDSFSKSHGLCNERLGIYYTLNSSLFTRHHTANIAFSAGPGRIKDFQFLALGNATEADKQGIRDLHDFWAKERRGLYYFLMKYQDLFEEKQLHIRDEDLKNPLGLYILLKTKPDINALKVFMKTGILGVDTKMKSGLHIRFSVGTCLNPYFDKFIPK